VLDKRKTDELVEAVEWLLDKRHRASSAIEGFNALLRPYMYVKKGATKVFLNCSGLGTTFEPVEAENAKGRQLMKP
jgi:hypothetical protein